MEVDLGESFLPMVGTDYIQNLKRNQEVLVGCTMMMLEMEQFKIKPQPTLMKKTTIWTVWGQARKQK